MTAIDDLIRDKLAEIDDLAELKVTLVALRLLELKQSPTAALVRDELAGHPALKHGLGIAPEITLEAALQRAVARGVLLAAPAVGSDRVRYFANNAQSRAVVESLQSLQTAAQAGRRTPTDAAHQTMTQLAAEIEKLEQIEVYPVGEEDVGLVREWLAWGYTSEELLCAVQAALREPRRKSAPPRRLRDCVPVVEQAPPAQPSLYYRAVIAHTERLPEEAVAFRDLAGRLPRGDEFQIIHTAAGLFGLRPTLEALKRIMRREDADISGLIALLAEQEDAQLSLLREQHVPDLLGRQIIQRYEAAFGLPVSAHIADEIAALVVEVPDLTVWQAAFDYALKQNKRDWRYIRKLVENPSPDLFVPQPVNEVAQYAFLEYRRRVGRGALDPSVAREINDLAQRVIDRAQWARAFDAAAAANALNWNYIKKVLTAPPHSQQPAGATRTTRGREKQPSTTKRSGSLIRRAQVAEASEEERAAARERARQRIAERARRKAQQEQSDDDRP
ncbi:MAG: hypothetical protein RMN25_07820 [Anaerolineae bacterium]|nr:hypothetical protein [Thermoflexales bacterium]MDW8407679.1 hypothetical protein [Anaerolineae bacterium]